MSAYKKAYLGAQNDAWFIILGDAPASSSDYPRHDADREAVAKVFDEAACRRMVAAWNACDGLSTEALEHKTVIDAVHRCVAVQNKWRKGRQELANLTRAHASLREVNAEMLEALQALLLRVTKGYDGLPQGYGIKLAEAAIAKATGQKGGAS